jgi:hypothetical protein
MKAVIGFTNGFGEREYCGFLGSFTKDLQQAYIFDDVTDADYRIHSIKHGFSHAPIWDTAVVIKIRIIEI